jgi:enediyne biosynthesis protein E4
MRAFAATTNNIAIEVVWRSGARSLVTNVAANRLYEIEETGAEPSRTRTKNDVKTKPMFKEVSALPGYKEATNAVQAAADLDGDGQLELFVGGQAVPGRWPDSASSFLYKRIDGKWTLDQENSKRLSGAGLVNGAIFSDMDGDCDADLVLACEWGPIRIFRNERGVLIEATAELGLAGYTGWWNGVGAGDFDSDGKTDLIASNFGRNTKYERYRSKPLRLVYGDFNGTGGVESMEAVYDEALRGYAPTLNVWTMARSMPWLLEKFGGYEPFSRATIEQALGERAHNAKHLEANWFESTIFSNRGGKFEARPLPIEAQFSPAFAVCVADFDVDGRQDVFLSQNMFQTPPETSRYDAGRGLLLRGDGKGAFEAIPGQKSGLLIYGEQRRATAADYDNDGRVDIAIQVGAATKFYRNVTAERE